MTALEEITQDEYSCDWCHKPFSTQDRVGFIRINWEVLSYHLGSCLKKAKKATKNEEGPEEYA